MKRFFILFVSVVSFGVHFLYAQHGQIVFSDSAVVSRLRQDVYMLASEEMQGREAGTAGERLAASYISQQMKEAGLLPLFDTTYYQTFTFSGEWEWGSQNSLIVDHSSFRHEHHFFTLPGSSSTKVRGQWIDIGCGEDIPGMLKEGVIPENRIWVMEYYTCDQTEGKRDASRQPDLDQRLQEAEASGAKAVILVNRLPGKEEPAIDLRYAGRARKIPVVFAGEDLISFLMQYPSAEIELACELNRRQHESLNVAGYIDNQSETTIVVGGHFDHLGYGGHTSREPGVHAIHYGADDNASGVAGMLEAARYFSYSNDTGSNYLFIAFGAEEKGLLGSHYFANSDAYDMDRINYMFNFDMIGRMDGNSLMLIGTGTSPVWDTLIDTYAPDHLEIRRSAGGAGGSDHTNFYTRQIPVLFFFTGIHQDYHRSSDTPDKINYKGMQEILSFTYDMMSGIDGNGKLAFTSTTIPEQTSRRSGSLTLGIMPDHTYEEGFRAQAVMDNRPAYRAGLKAGDVILRINDREIADIYAYMEALKALEGASKAIIIVERDGKEFTFEVQF